MIFRKTIKTKCKGIYNTRKDTYKTNRLFIVYTYWFLFIPVYSTEVILDA